MQTAEGVVKALSKYGKGFALEGVDGWFTAYKDADVAGVEPGVTVQFKYKTKANPNGADYKNITGQVNVTSNAPAGGGSSGGGGSNRGNSSSTGQQIMRQNALTNATALYASGVIDTANSAKGAISDVLKIANVFANYSEGNIAITGWPGENAERPEAAEQEPEPEPTPDPEPVQQSASSLGDFMNG